MAKLLKDIIAEVSQPESPGDKQFKDKHIIGATDLPFKDGKSIWDIMNGRNLKKDDSKIASYKEGDDAKIYEDNDLETDNIIESLKQITESDSALELTFKNGETIEVDSETAAKLIAVAEELTDDNKEIFINHLEESEESFDKMLDFVASVIQ
tara:strand:- start:760 stop:1218 length:459 start_codon:yes stop_codon:yes gene_type:complete